MVDCLHAPVQAKCGQRVFLALAEGNGRTPEGDFEVCIWFGFRNGACCVGACEGLLEGVARGCDADEERHAGRRAT